MKRNQKAPISQRTGLLLKLSRQEKTNFGSIPSETCSEKVSKWVVSLSHSDDVTKTYQPNDNQASQSCSVNSSAGKTQFWKETLLFQNNLYFSGLDSKIIFSKDENCTALLNKLPSETKNDCVVDVSLKEVESGQEFIDNSSINKGREVWIIIL